MTALFSQSSQSMAVPEIFGYQFVRRIGVGGMGDAILAKQLSLDREVAIKILKPLPEVMEAEQTLRLLDNLEDLMDVQKVYSNADFPEEVLEKYQSEG